MGKRRRLLLVYQRLQRDKIRRAINKEVVRKWLVPICRPVDSRQLLSPLKSLLQSRPVTNLQVCFPTSRITRDLLQVRLVGLQNLRGRLLHRLLLNRRLEPIHRPSSQTLKTIKDRQVALLANQQLRTNSSLHKLLNR